MTERLKPNPETVSRLQRISPDLATLYVSVVSVVEDATLEESSVFVAHGLREVMNALVREVLWVEHSSPGVEILEADRLRMGQESGPVGTTSSTTSTKDACVKPGLKVNAERAHSPDGEVNTVADGSSSSSPQRTAPRWQKPIKPPTDRQVHRHEVELMYQVMLMTSDQERITIATKPWMTLRNKVEGKAHMGNSWTDKVALTQDDFRTWVSEFEKIIDGLFVSYMRVTERLMETIKKSASGSPTIEQVREAVILARTAPIHWRMFFSELNNPLWAPMLLEVGAFGKVPILHSEGQHEVSVFRPWVAGSYLVWVAEENAVVVSRVAEQNQNQENVEVIATILQAISKLNAKDIKPIVWCIHGWMARVGVISHAGITIADIIAELLRGGFAEKAKQLATMLWSIKAYSKDLSAEEISDAALGNYIESENRMSEFAFMESIRNVSPRMIDADAQASLSIFGELLRECIELERSRYGGKWNDDGSFIWRPAIEDHSQNSLRDWRDSVVEAARDSAIGYVKASKDTAEALVEVGKKMEEYSSPVFQRIALHAYAEFLPDFTASQPLIENAFSPLLFGSVYVTHELHRLVQMAMPVLSEHNKEILVQNWAKAQEGFDMESGILNETVGSEMLSWYAEVEGHVPESMRTLISRAREQGYEARPYPGFGIYRESGWVKRESPINIEELAAMPIPTLIAAINQWVPPEEPFGSTPISFANALEEVVQEKASEILTHLPAFANLEATYWVGVIEGVKKYEGRSQWTEEQWGQFLDFLMNVCEAMAGDPVQESTWNRYNPATVLMSIANLLSESHENGEFALHTLPRVWKILSKLVAIAKPKSMPEELGGAFTFTLNTAYGVSLHAVARYLQSTYALLDGEEDNIELLRELTAEGWGVLGRELRGTEDRASSARVVCAGYIPALYTANRRWLEQNLELIFPHNEEDVDQWCASWSTYVRYCHPYEGVVDCLWAEYEHALEIRQFDRKAATGSDWWYRYIQHICVMRVNGALERIPTGVETWNRFIRECAPQGLHQAIGHIGRGISREVHDPLANPLPQSIVSRAQLVWSEIIDQLDSEAEDEERKRAAAGFGWWAVSGQFDLTWVLENATRVVAVAGQIDELPEILEIVSEEEGGDKDLVFKFLRELARQHWSGDLTPIKSRVVQTLFLRIGLPENESNKRELEDALEFFMPLDPSGFAEVRGKIFGKV